VISLDVEDAEENDEGSSPLHEKLTDERQINPSQTSEKNEMQRLLAGALKLLPDREQLVLSLYYYEELTFKEIGKTLDISESRVCQIHGRAMTNLKSLLKSKEIN
jgi:RNA polymerase sigma factor for flagellar operon FliA